MSNIDSLVGGFRSSLKKQRPQKNPIQDHPLAKAGDEIRKMYIDTLCVVAHYETENPEKRLALVERIHSGAGLSNAFSEHIDGVNDMSSEQLHAFIKVCKENKLENIFVLECILISQADGERNEEQYNFTLDLAEALGLKEDRISVLSELADAIYEKDSEKYRGVYEKLSPADAAEVVGGAIGYIKEFVSGVLIDTPELLWIYSPKREGYVIEGSDSTENSAFSSSVLAQISKALSVMAGGDVNYTGHIKVVVENTAIKSTLGFEDCKSVFLRNCTAYKPVSFNTVDSVIIDGCSFDFNKEKQVCSLHIAKVSCISISECKFSNMVFEGDYTALLNCYDCSDCTINMEKNSFFNLSSRTSYNTGYVIIPFENGKVSPSFKVKNCDFTNCSGRGLFPPDIDKELDNNVYSNCCSESMANGAVGNINF